jgi:hypothetical protein
MAESGKERKGRRVERNEGKKEGGEAKEQKTRSCTVKHPKLFVSSK